jgi:hypothetical protein
MNHPNVTGATNFAPAEVLTPAFAAAYTFHITIKVFRSAETVCMRKRRNRWTRRIRTTSWNSRRRVRSCTCPSVQQIPTSTFRPTVTAKAAGSPVGCARSRCSAGSAPKTPAAPFPRKLGQGTLPPWALGVRTLRNRANEAGDTRGGVVRLSAALRPLFLPLLTRARFGGSLLIVPCARHCWQRTHESGTSWYFATPSARSF